MACDHRLIQKQWMLGQVGYEDSCPECDKKRIAELEKESAEDFEKTEEQLDEKNRRIAEWKIWADATIQVLQLYKFDSQKIETLQATMPKENEK